MQVFIPVAKSLAASAETLDRKRAGNQCWRESKTLLGTGWANHPARSLFTGHVGAFATYNIALIHHVFRNGWCKPETHSKWHDFWTAIADGASQQEHELPVWWGDERIHSSHRAVLLYKDPDWYSQFGWKEKAQGPDADGKMPYLWPCDMFNDYLTVCNLQVIGKKAA